MVVSATKPSALIEADIPVFVTRNNGRPFSGIDAWSPAARWDDMSGNTVVRSNGGPVPTGSTGAAPQPAEDIFADLDSRI